MIPRRFRIVPACLLAGLAAGMVLRAQAPPKKANVYDPHLAKASDEAEKAIPRFKLDKGLKVSFWAAEPMLAHPVAFAFDEQGRCYVAETYRHSAGVTDNRGHMYWLDDDLASRTVADRVAMYKRHLKNKFADYEKEHDRVRLLEDTKGAGKADKSTVFADGFHHAEEGIGAGVLARKGNVYYTCIPNLWLLKDTNGDGKADVREVLSTGYGIHVAFIGHDLHGLRMGPDGRLYFSLGDRGLNVKTKEGKTLFYPDTGAVLRCEPDGSNLEVFAYGLRNPQELAFDDHGNLFTVDNNSDSGDQARFVYVVEGGDSGWRIGYQYGSEMGNRGPWNAEKIWHLPHEGRPAYALPPLAHFSAGPSGFTHYPGIGLPDRYAGHFFLADFRGNSGGSGVWSFATKPKGAAFEMADAHQFVWSVLATDCDFGPDSAFYISDWVEGWNKTGKGRIYKVTDPEQQKKPAVAEAKKLFAEGFDKRPAEELVKLLGHPHQQIRLEAQFALAARGKDAVEPFAKAAKDGKGLARLHGIWGLGQVARAGAPAGKVLSEFVSDPDPEVRAQALKTAGDAGLTFVHYAEGLRDSEPRVRLMAALALAKVPPEEANSPKETLPAIVTMLRQNADKDGYLRHAGVMALSRLSADSLAALAKEDSPAVRLGAVLALRRQHSPKVGVFLKDSDPNVVAEAARAIHDEPIPDALPKLADLIVNPRLPEPVLFRVLNANFRLGRPENAAVIAKFAAFPDAPEKLRVLALKMLAEWAKPPRRDYVTGLTQDLGTRPAEVAAEALRPVLGGVFGGPNNVRKQATQTATKLGIKEVGPALLEMVADANRPAEVRVEALRGLEALKDARLAKAVDLAVGSADPRLRNAGRRVLAKTSPEAVVKQLAGVLEKGEPVEKQGAFHVLGEINDANAGALLEAWMDRLLAKQVPAELQLDLLEAAAKWAKGKKQTLGLGDKLVKFESSRPKNDELANYRETLAGGDALAGRRIFLTKSEVACLRCHKVGGVGGEVGPALDGIGSKQTRDYLLESIVLPNKQIAKGFETVVITTAEGKRVSGIIRGEDAKEVKLITDEGKIVTVPKADIDDRRGGKSAMPEDVVKHLSKSELRDLVEFLANLKESKK